MSFDMEVWFELEPITVEVANEKLIRAGEDNDLSGFIADARVLAAHDALLRRFPAFEFLPDDEVDDAVWSMTPAASDQLLWLNVIWPKADEFGAAVREIAGEYGLMCMDAFEKLTHPPGMTNAKRVKMFTERGSLAFEPDLAMVQAMLASLNRTNWFAILDRPDDWYIQVGRRQGALSWSLEYREGIPDRHYATEVDTLDGVAEAFWAFGNGDYAWQASYERSKLDLG